MGGQRDSGITNICMLSTHGYFEPVPQMGKTDTGGQVMYVLELSKAISMHGIKVDIFTRWFDSSKKQVETVPGYPNVRIIRIPAGPWEFIPKEDIYDVLPDLAENMTGFIRGNGIRYDLFHGHYVDAGIVTLDVAKAFGMPAFFTGHSLGAWKRDQMGGNPEEMDRKYKFGHRIAEELRIFKTVRAQTVTTDVQKQKLEKLYEFAADNIVVIPAGVNIHTFHQFKRGENKVENGLPRKYILCLSRIDTNKGHDFLLNAFDIVRREIPDVHLVIGGGSPRPQQRELEVLGKMNAIIDQKDMRNRVHIVGYVPDELIVPSYQKARLFVMPSLFEPFGMTALEAMACGRPVVASRFGGISDVISHRESGMLVDPSDASEFAEAMILLLRDRRLARSIGQEGHKTTCREFSWEAIAGKFLAFYREYMNL